MKRKAYALTNNSDDASNATVTSFENKYVKQPSHSNEKQIVRIDKEKMRDEL